MEESSNIQALPMPDELPLHERFESMRLGLVRSYYYYEMRLTFWNCYMFLAASMETVLGLSAISVLFNSESLWLKCLVSISAFAAFVAKWFGATKRITCLTEQKLATKQVQNMLPSCAKEEEEGGEKLYCKIKKMREEFELRDDVILECVDAICHNKACVTLGVQQRYKLTWWQRSFGRIFPLPYTERAELV